MPLVDISKIDDQLSVSPQIGEADFEMIAALGYKSVLNLRPDGEKGDYLPAEDASRIAADKGLTYQHIPVPRDGPSEDHIEAFFNALGSLPGPILAHCGSGRRVAILWALAAVGRLNVEEIITRCAGAGHDIQKLRPALERKSQST